MLQTARQVVRGWNRDDAALLSAAVSYYIGLSLFPVMLLLTSGLGVFLKWTQSGQDARQYIFTAIGEQLSPVLAENIQHALDHVQNNAVLGGPLGVLTLLVTGLAIFAQFERAFDRIWNVSSPTPTSLLQSAVNVLTHRLRAFAMLASLGLVIVAVFLAGMAFTAFKMRMPPSLTSIAWLWWSLETSLAIGLNAAVFTLIYRLLPKVLVTWSQALRGGCLAAIIWEFGRQLLAAVVVSQNYTGAYGVIGSLLAIMLWGYYAVAVIFIGAEFIQVLRGHTATDPNRPTTTPTRKTTDATRKTTDPTRPATAPPAPIRPRTRRELRPLITAMLDLSAACLILYVGLFVGLRYFRTYPDARLNAEHPQHNVVVFSRDPATQRRARIFFAPLIRTLPGPYHYPPGDEISQLAARLLPAQAKRETPPTRQAARDDLRSRIIR